jgi:hypothetical protein
MVLRAKRGASAVTGRDWIAMLRARHPQIGPVRPRRRHRCRAWRRISGWRSAVLAIRAEAGRRRQGKLLAGYAGVRPRRWIQRRCLVIRGRGRGECRARPRAFRCRPPLGNLCAALRLSELWPDAHGSTSRADGDAFDRSGPGGVSEGAEVKCREWPACRHDASGCAGPRQVELLLEPRRTSRMDPSTLHTISVGRAAARRLGYWIRSCAQAHAASSHGSTHERLRDQIPRRGRQRP